MKKVVLLLLTVITLLPLPVLADDQYRDQELKSSSKEEKIFLTRIDALKLILDETGMDIAIDEKDKNCFADVHEGWEEEYACFAYKHGYLIKNNEFFPDRFILGNEYLKILYHSFGEFIISDSNHPDWGKAYIGLATRDDIMINTKVVSKLTHMQTLNKILFRDNHFPSNNFSISENQLFYGELRLNTKENDSEMDIAIHPNPTNERLFIQTTCEQKSIELRVVSIEGKTIDEIRLEECGHFELNTSSYPNGEYLLQFTTNGKTQTKKFVVIK